MGDPGGQADHDRCVITFGKVKSRAGHVQAFLAVGRFEHRQFGRPGIMAAVLLVLRAVHARIIGNHDHQAAVDTGVGRREQGVGSDIDTDMLHAGHRPAAGDAGADSDFQADLFIRRPFGCDPGIPG